MFGWLRRPEAPAAPLRAVEVAVAPAAGPVPARRAEAVLRRVEWTVLRRLDGLLQGDYRTLFRGFGLDLADLREYQPGDDVRRIDWNATARLQSAHVRECQEDREVAAWFLLDLSGSIDFGSTGQLKRELAAEFVALLSSVLARHGNRVGAIVHGDAARTDEVTRIPARTGRAHLLHLVVRVLRPRPRAAGGRDAPARDGALTDLAELLERAQGPVRRRSVVFVVSDFVSRPGWDEALGRLARRHDVTAVRLVDPVELALPDAGFVVLEDAETGEQRVVDTSDPRLRRRFEAAAEAREAALRQGLARAGVDCLQLATDEPIEASLLAFVQLRKRRSQLASGVTAR